MKTIGRIILGMIFGILVWAGVQHVWFQPEEAVLPDIVPVEELVEVETVEVEEPILAVETPVLPLPGRYRIPAVPFIVQAPAAQWGNPIFQDACEEASIIMAHAWLEGKSLTTAGATEEILKLAEWQEGVFGHTIDTSIIDTGRMLGEYFGVTSYATETGVTVDDIKRSLAADRVVIVPTDGRLLQNPNFTPPGPPRHMLVIVGYDTLTKEFIVNDPGTRRGEGYRYTEAILYDAILDYPTGNHREATSTDKVMLTVWREETI